MTYTYLMDIVENIFLATQGMLQYLKPKPRKETKQYRPSGKFCRFHNIMEHDTNECCYLRDVIENYIRMNKLP